MAEPLALVSRDADKNNAEEVLREALDLRPDSVIVFCFDKEHGQIITKSSDCASTLTVIGALAMAQYDLLRNGSAG